MKTEPNIPDPDGFYAALVQAHEGLDEPESAALNARLVLLLANQIGDQRVLLDCVATARTVGDELQSRRQSSQNRSSAG